MKVEPVPPAVAPVAMLGKRSLFGRLALHFTYLMILLVTVQRDDLSPVNLPIGSMRTSELLAAGALVLFLFDILVTGNPIRAPRRVTNLVFLFLGVMFLSSFLSAQITWGPNQYAYVRRLDRELPFVKSYTTMLSWLFGIAVFFAIVLMINTPARLKAALKWWVIGGAVCSVVAIYSAPAAIFGWPFGDMIGVSLRNAAPGDVSGASDVLPRVYGLTGEPRHLVSFLVSLLPFLILATFSRVYVMPRWAQRASLPICGIAYLLTLSRSTVVYGAALLGLLVVFSAARGKRLHLGSVLRSSLMILVMLVALSLVIQGMLIWFGLPDLITIIRLQINSLGDTQYNLSNWFQEIGWSVAWAAFWDHPLLGVGIGNLTFYADRYIPPKPDWLPEAQYFVVAPVNNLYLDILSEMGLLGLGAFGLLMGTLTNQAWQVARRVGPESRAVILGLLGGVIMLLIAYVFFSAFMFAYVWTAIGLLCVATRLALIQPDQLESILDQKSNQRRQF